MDEDAGNVVHGTYVNGFYEETPIAYGESAYGYARNHQVLLNVADGKRIQLVVGEEPLDLATGTVEAYERSLDLRTGVLARTLRWRAPGGTLVEVESRRLVSLARQSVAAIDFRVTLLEGTAPLRVVSRIHSRVHNQEASDDPRVGAHLPEGALHTIHREASGTWGAVVQRTGTTRLAIAAAVDHVLHADDAVRRTLRTSSVADEEGVGLTVDVLVSPGESVGMTKVLAYVTSLDHPEDALVTLARDAIDEVRGMSFDALVEEQRAVLDRFWAVSDVELDGDGALQQGVRFNLFSLFQSAGRDGRTSIAAKGLTGEGYEGHYFWDTEIFALPFFAYTQPDIARSLLQYRVSMLDKARARAAELSQRGALYPWRTIGGEEASAYYPAGTAQYHIDADISYAIRRYVTATGDRSLAARGRRRDRVRDGAAVGRPRRLHRRAGRRVLHQRGDRPGRVHGPRQQQRVHEPHGARQPPLRGAAGRGAPGRGARDVVGAHRCDRARRDRGGGVDAGRGRDADPARRSPRDPRPGRLVPRPRAVGLRGHAERPLPAAAPLPPARDLPPPGAQAVGHRAGPGPPRQPVLDRREEAQLRLLRPAHDRRLLALAVHPERRRGRARVRRPAYRYFLQTARMDLDDVNGNVSHGVHVAAMAGTWVSLVSGFGGLRDDDGRLSFAPRLPTAWTRLAFRLRVGDALLRVTMTRHETTYALEAGGPLELRHFGRAVTVLPDAPAVIAMDPRLEAVVFDLDGVITDTAEHHFRAWQRLAAEVSLPFDRELNERLKGVSRMESLQIILDNAGQTASLADKVRLADRKNAYFRELIEQVTPADLLPGMGELLADLRARGIRTGIASMSHNVWDVVERLGIRKLVDVIVDPASLVKGKPDPEIFLSAADQLGVRLEDCAGIEDAKAGIEAIKAARMAAVGVGAGLDGADWAVTDTRDLTVEALGALFGGRVGGRRDGAPTDGSAVAAG